MDIDNSSFYEILNVSKEATKDEIKIQYKKLASKYNPEDETDFEMLEEINKAYEILSDPEKKKIYDKYGEEGLEKLYYEDQFTGVKSEDNKRKCRSRIYFAMITLEDIYKGSKINVSYSRKALSGECEGTGSDNPAARLKCKFCDGKGDKVNFR